MEVFIKFFGRKFFLQFLPNLSPLPSSANMLKPRREQLCTPLMRAGAILMQGPLFWSSSCPLSPLMPAILCRGGGHHHYGGGRGLGGVVGWALGRGSVGGRAAERGALEK